MKCPINGNEVEVPCNIHYCPFNVNGCKYKQDMDDTEIAKAINVAKRDVIKLREEGLRNIEILVIVDKYYDFLLSLYSEKNAYSQLVCELTFPFNFPKHKWTKLLLKKAFLKKNWKKFCREESIAHDITILGDYNETTSFNRNRSRT